MYALIITLQTFGYEKFINRDLFYFSMLIVVMYWLSLLLFVPPLKKKKSLFHAIFVSIKEAINNNHIRLILCSF